MNKRIKIYGLAWLVALVVFNVITFITPNEIVGLTKFDGAFWIGYIFITLAFIGQFFCTAFALKEKNKQKLFYKISLVSISYTGLVLMLIAGSLTMVIPNLPYWLGIIVCLLVLAFTAFFIIKATAAIDEVERIDCEVKTHTYFIKALTADAEHLMLVAKTPEMKTETKKVYEALRYSDPMSKSELNDVNGQITDMFAEFETAVNQNNIEIASELSYKILNLIDKRNKRCKLLK